MAEICVVCGEEITSENREVYKSINDPEGLVLHDYCLTKYVSKPEKYSGTAEEAEEWSHLICPVCNKDLDTQVDKIWYPISDIRVHDRCNNVFKLDPESYGGANTDLDFANKEVQEAQVNLEKEHQKQQQRIEEKSVYVKGFSMPFGEMVEFMVKWAIASIPAFIILFIIFGIFFAIFGSLFF